MIKFLIIALLFSPILYSQTFEFKTAKGTSLVEFELLNTIYGINLTSSSLNKYKFNCEIPISYHIQSRDSDHNWTEWVNEKGVETFKVRDIDTQFKNNRVLFISNIIKKHQQDLEQIDGIFEDVKLRKFKVVQDEIRCNTQKTKILDFCEHYFNGLDLLEATTKDTLNSMFNSVNGRIPRNLAQCKQDIRKVSKTNTLILNSDNFREKELFKFFPHLKNLTWNNTTNNNWDFLEYLNTLEKLVINNTKNLSPKKLKYANGVKELEIKNSNISSDEFLRDFRSLVSLNLDNNNLKSLSLALENQTNQVSNGRRRLMVRRNTSFNTLSIQNNPNLKIINGDFHFLRNVYLTNTGITNINFLKSSSNLKNLDLSNTKINLNDSVNYTPPSGINYDNLNLSGIGLQNLNFFNAIEGVQNLNLSNNSNLNDFSILAEKVTSSLNLNNTAFLNAHFPPKNCPIIEDPQPGAIIINLPGVPKKPEVLSNKCKEWREKFPPLITGDLNL